MAPAPKRGDVLIRQAGDLFEVVDAVTVHPLGKAPSFMEAVELAASYRAAVWRENVDARGRAGDPTLLLPEGFFEEL